MKEKLLKLNIQLFAEGDPEPEEPTQQELDDLEKELGGDPEPEPSPEPKTDPKPDDENPEEDPKPDDENPEEDPNNEDDKEKKTGIKALREAHEAEKKKAKELEEAKAKLEQESKTTREKLLKAIRLGIKGETEEEILENLEAYEVKEEAGRKGLTEEQVRKDAELKAQMEKLSQEKQEVLFNRRAYQLQVKKNLSEEDVTNFIERASEIGIDLLTNPNDFDKIYDSIMGVGNTDVVAAKDAEIAELKAEIKRIKGEKAPERSPDGNDDNDKEKDWEQMLKEMQ